MATIQARIPNVTGQPRVHRAHGTRPRVTLYRTLTCPFCVAAEALLRAKGVVLEQVFLDDHPDRRAFTAALRAGHRTVPLIVIGTEPVGGYDDLVALDRDGRLDRLLAARADG